MTVRSGPLAEAALDGPHHVGPLPQAPADAEHHAGPLPQTPPRRYRKTWREKRWERKRRRRFTEEVLGWILVPVIVVAVFWAAKSGLNAMGTNFTDLVKGIKTAISSSGRGG